MQRYKRYLFLLMVVPILLGMTGCMSTPDSGEIGVVRNGGPFDNKNIRGYVPNGAGNTWVGWMSDVHYYPVDTQQRFFKMKTCYDGQQAKICKGADSLAVTVPTADGVEVSIEGIFYLNTVFNDSAAGKKALAAFDTQFATRTFDGEHAYNGTEGWSAFLGAIVEPIVANNLREVIAGVRCADLKSSCALVQNQQGISDQVKTLANGGVNQSKISQIQDKVQTGLNQDLKNTLGTEYFKNIKFSLNAVTLPPSVESAIETAQASFAQVSQAQAKVKSAKLDAQANVEKQRGYNKCPTCARIDAIKALPRGLTALGGNFALAVK